MKKIKKLVTSQKVTIKSLTVDRLATKFGLPLTKVEGKIKFLDRPALIKWYRFWQNNVWNHRNDTLNMRCTTAQLVMYVRISWVLLSSTKEQMAKIVRKAKKIDEGDIWIKAEKAKIKVVFK